QRNRGRRSRGASHPRGGQRPVLSLHQWGPPGPIITGMSRVFAVANQKGGVAKTTTVHSLGSALAERGHRVLLIDLDPQACLSCSLGVESGGTGGSLHDAIVHQ